MADEDFGKSKRKRKAGTCSKCGLEFFTVPPIADVPICGRAVCNQRSGDGPQRMEEARKAPYANLARAKMSRAVRYFQKTHWKNEY